MFNKGYIAINPKDIEFYENEIIVAVQRIDIEETKKYDSYEDIPKDILVEIWHFENGEKYKNQLDYLYHNKNLTTRYIQAYKKDTTEEHIKKDLTKKGYTNIKTSEELRNIGIEEHKKRGKDKKPRTRRTKEQIEKDKNYIQKTIKIDKKVYAILEYFCLSENQIDEMINIALKNHIKQQKQQIMNIFNNLEE